MKFEVCPGEMYSLTPSPRTLFLTKAPTIAFDANDLFETRPAYSFLTMSIITGNNDAWVLVLTNTNELGWLFIMNLNTGDRNYFYTYASKVCQ